MTVAEGFGYGITTHIRRECEKLSTRRVSRETIGKIERGTAAPLFDTVEKIAHALSITPVELFGASPTPPGNRGKLLLRIHTKLADMNDRQLGQIAKIMDVLS